MVWTKRTLGIGQYLWTVGAGRIMERRSQACPHSFQVHLATPLEIPSRSFQVVTRHGNYSYTSMALGLVSSTVSSLRSIINTSAGSFLAFGQSTSVQFPLQVLKKPTLPFVNMLSNSRCCIISERSIASILSTSVFIH